MSGDTDEGPTDGVSRGRFPRVRALADYGATFATFGATKLRGILVLAVATRIYGLESYGAYTFGAQVAQTVAALALLGTGTAIVLEWNNVEVDSRRAVVRNLYARVVVVSTIGGAILLGLLLLGVRGSWSEDLVPVAGAAAATGVPASIIALASNVYRASGRIGTFAAVGGARVAAEILPFTAVAVAGGSALAATVSSFVTTMVVATLLGALALRRSGPPVPWSQTARSDTTRVIRTSLPLAGVDLSRNIVDKADRLVLGVLATPAVIGAYSGGFAVASFLYAAIPPYVTATLPTLRDQWARSAQDGLARAKRHTRRLSLLIVGIVVVLSLSVGTILEYLVDRASPELTPVTLVLVCGAALYAAGRVQFMPLMLAGLQGRFARRTLFTGIVEVGFVAVGVTLAGTVGAAVGAAAAYALFYGAIVHLSVSEHLGVVARQSLALGVAAILPLLMLARTL